MVALGQGLAPTKFRVLSTATTNATVVKTSGGAIADMVLGNGGAAVAYMRFYDLARAPIPASDTPFMTLILAANGIQTVYQPEYQPQFTNGLAFVITTGAPDTDTTATAANQVAGQINYY